MVNEFRRFELEIKTKMISDLSIHNTNYYITPSII